MLHLSGRCKSTLQVGLFVGALTANALEARAVLLFRDTFDAFPFDTATAGRYGVGSPLGSASPFAPWRLDGGGGHQVLLNGSSVQFHDLGGGRILIFHTVDATGYDRITTTVRARSDGSRLGTFTNESIFPGVNTFDGPFPDGLFSVAAPAGTGNGLVTSFITVDSFFSFPPPFLQRGDVAVDYIEVDGAPIVFGFGESQQNPLPPTTVTHNPAGGAVFGFSNAPSGAWIDPPMATGFTYEMTDGSLFNRVVDFPTGYSNLRILVDGQIFGPFVNGDLFNFVNAVGHGVSSFTVTGITPNIDLGSPNAGLAFPLRLEFDRSVASFTMTSMQTSADPVIPEPASVILFAFAFGLLTYSRSFGHRACAGK